MSEARTQFDGYSDAPTYVARLCFAANEPLREHLTDFYAAPYAATLGRGALFLYSEAGIGYTRDHSRWHDEDASDDVTELQRVAQLQSTLRHRTRGQRSLASEVGFKRLPEQHPGMLIRLRVVLDQLSVRALQDTVFLDPDQTVRVGYEIPMERLEQGMRLQQARDRLNKALETGSPLLAVDTLDLIELHRLR